jgi:hypothetical protein
MRLLHVQRSMSFEIQQKGARARGRGWAATCRRRMEHMRPPQTRARIRPPCGTRRPGCPSRCVPCGGPLPPARWARGQNAGSLTLTRPCKRVRVLAPRAKMSGECATCGTWALCRTRAERKGDGWVTHLTSTPFSTSICSSPPPTLPVSASSIPQSHIFCHDQRRNCSNLGPT